MTSALLVSSVAMISTTLLVVAGPMHLSSLGANQFGRKSSLILALMKDHFKVKKNSAIVSAQPAYQCAGWRQYIISEIFDASKEKNPDLMISGS